MKYSSSRRKKLKLNKKLLHKLFQPKSDFQVFPKILSKSDFDKHKIQNSFTCVGRIGARLKKMWKKIPREGAKSNSKHEIRIEQKFKAQSTKSETNSKTIISKIQNCFIILYFEFKSLFQISRLKDLLKTLKNRTLLKKALAIITILTVIITGCLQNILQVQAASFTLYQTAWNTADLTSGFSEIDPNSHITVSSSRATGTALRRNESAYLYKDFTANFFDGLSIDFEMYVDTTSANSSQGELGLTVNTIGSTNSWATTDVRVIAGKNSSGNYIFTLARGAAPAASQSYTGAGNTLYYCTLSRTAGSDTISLNIYSDNARFILLATLSVAGFGTSKFRYFYPLVSNNVSSTAAWTGYFQNISLPSGVVATHNPNGSNQTILTSYSAKDTNLTTVNNNNDLQSSIIIGSVTQTDDSATNTGFNLNGKSFNQTEVVGTGNGASVKLRFNLPASPWTTMAAAPGTIYGGGSLVYPGSGDYIYGFRGYNTTDFYRYSISGNSWTTMAAAPGTINSGGSLVYPGSGDYIYGFMVSEEVTPLTFTVSFLKYTTPPQAPLLPESLTLALLLSIGAL